MFSRLISPRLAGSGRHDMNRLHGKKLSRLARCPGQVDRVPRVGGLPCLACKRFNSLSKEMFEKLALSE